MLAHFGVMGQFRVWGRLLTGAPICNGRNLRGLPTRAQDAMLPHNETDPLLTSAILTMLLSPHGAMYWLPRRRNKKKHPPTMRPVCKCWKS
jgi:hypothetical protein